MAFTANQPICVSGAPVDQVSDFSGLKPLSGDGGAYEFTCAFTELREGKNDKELCDGSYGRVVYVTLTGEVADIKTHESRGKVSFPIFLNTKSHFIASQIAAFCGIYNKEEERSEYIPAVRYDKDNNEHWHIPALEKKSWIVGLVKSGTYTTQKGDEITQYNLTGVLNTNFVTAAHALAGKNDQATKLADWKRFKEYLDKSIEQYKVEEQMQTQSAYNAGAGASAYGTQTTSAPTSSQFAQDFTATANSLMSNGAQPIQQASAPTEPAFTDSDIPF